MKRRVTSKTKSAASKLILKWMPRLGLGDWNIALEEKAQADPEDEGCVFKTKADVSIATIYSMAKISIYPAFSELDSEAREEVIVHELIHCNIARLERLITMQREGKMITPDEADKENEGLTEVITRSILLAWGGGK